MIMCRPMRLGFLTVAMVVVTTYSIGSQSNAAIMELDPEAPTKRIVKRFTQDADRIWSDVVVDGDCPVNHREVRASVDGVLIRSRIRPLSLGHGGDAQMVRRMREAIDGLIYLGVSVGCLVREVGKPIFDIDVRLGIEYMGMRAMKHPFSDLVLRALLEKNYGAFGVGDKEYILEVVEDSVEDAVTVYIAAHMDP